MRKLAQRKIAEDAHCFRASRKEVGTGILSDLKSLSRFALPNTV